MVKNLHKESSLATSFLESFPKKLNQVHNDNHQMTSSINDMQKIAKYSPGAFRNWLNIWRGNKNLQQIFKKNNLYRQDITSPNQKIINSYANQVNKVASSNSASLKTATVHNYHIVNSIAGLSSIYSHASNQASAFNQANSYVNSHNLSSVNNWLNSHSEVTSEMYLCTKPQASALIDTNYKANHMVYDLLKNKEGIVNKSLLPNSSAYQAKKSKVASLPSGAISPIDKIKSLNLSEIRSSVNRVANNNQKLVDSLKSELSPSSTTQNNNSQMVSQSTSAQSVSSSVDLTKINTEPLKSKFNTASPFWKQMRQAENNLASSTSSSANLMSINSDLYLASSAKASSDETKSKPTSKSSIINHNYNDVAMAQLNKVLHNSTGSTKKITASIEHKYIDNNIAMNYLHRRCGIDPKIVNYMTNRGLIRGIKGHNNVPPKIEFVKRAPRNENEANHYTTQDYHLKNSVLHDIKLEGNSYKAHQGSQEEKVVGADYINLKPTKDFYTDKSGKHAIYKSVNKLNQAGQKHYGFNFRLHNGKDKLYVFTSPQDTLGYLQTHLNDYKGLNNATFVSFDKDVNAGDIQKFINHQYPRRGQFNKIILCPPNNPQGYQMVQKITSQFGNRSKYVNNRLAHQKLIETEVPMSENRHYNDMILRKPQGFNETWINQLRCQTMHNHKFERPSMHLNLNQYSLMNAQQAMLNMSRQDSGRFDAISHLYNQINQNEHKGIEKIDAKNPRINMIQELKQKMKPQAKHSLKRYMNYSGYYLSANEMSKYTAKAFQKKYMDANHPNPTNKALGNFNVQEALKKPYNLDKLQLNTNQVMNSIKDSRNKRLYATAMNATTSMWKRRIILFYHNKKRGRAVYQKEHLHKIEPLKLKTVRKYIKQIKIADAIREESYKKLSNKGITKLTPDLKKLNLVAKHQAKPKITGADAINDIKITHSMNKYMAKHQLKPYHASDILGNKLQKMINNKPKHSPLAQRKAPVPYLLRKVSPNDRKNYVGVIKNFDKFLESSNNKQGAKYLQKGRVCYKAMTSSQDKKQITDLHLPNMTRQRFNQVLNGLGISNNNHMKSAKATVNSQSVQPESPKSSSIPSSQSKATSSQVSSSSNSKSNPNSMNNNDLKSQAKAVYAISKDSSANKSRFSQANNTKSVSANSNQKSKVYTKVDITRHAKNYIPNKRSIEHAGYNVLRAFKVQPKYWELTTKATRIFNHSYQAKKPDDKNKDYQEITKLLAKIPKAERNKSRQAVGCIKNFNNRQIYVDSITQFTKHALDPKFTLKNNKNIHRFQSNKNYNATVKRHLSPKNNNKSHSKNQLQYHGQNRPRL